MGNGHVRLKQETNDTPRLLINIGGFDLRVKQAVRSVGENDEPE